VLPQPRLVGPRWHHQVCHRHPNVSNINLPPVPSAARIIQPANEDTALFILQSIQKTGVHMPPGKWTTLVRLLWDSPPNQGPFYKVYREWSESGRSRNIRMLVEALFCHYGDYNAFEHPYPSTIQVLAKRLSSKAATARAADKDHRDANACRVEVRQHENNHQEGAVGMLPEGYGVDAPNVHGALPARQHQLQDACSFLAQNPSLRNDHLHPVMCVDPPPEDQAVACAALISLAPGIPASQADGANAAATTPLLPLMGGENTAQIFPRGHNAGAAGGGVDIIPPTINYPPAAVYLLPAHPGPAGTANNLAAGRQQQQNCNRRIASDAMEGVGDTVFIDEVDAKLLRHPRNRNNIGVIDGINSAMLQATRMISQAISTRAHSPATATAAATAAPLPPGGDGNVIASFYSRLEKARAANRADAVTRYEGMIDWLERKEEEEMEARLLRGND
jgi:hypothetical protein